MAGQHTRSGTRAARDRPNVARFVLLEVSARSIMSPARASMRVDRSLAGILHASTNPFERDLDRQRRELHAADAAFADRRARPYTYPEHLAVSMAIAGTAWVGNLHAQPATRVGAYRGPVSGSRYRSGHGGEHAGDGRRAFGVPMDRMCTQPAEHAARRRGDRNSCSSMGGAKVLVTDTEYSPTVEKALAQLAKKPLVIDIVDALGQAARLGKADYETFIATAIPSSRGSIRRQWNAISLNYTSGTTAIRRASSTTTAAPTSTRCRTSSIGNAAARVTWDAADVPLQRLVLRMDDGRERRRQRLSAQGRRAAHLRRDPHAQVTHYCGAAIVQPDVIQPRPAEDEDGGSITSCTASSPAQRRPPR